MAAQFCTNKREELAQLIHLYRNFMLIVCLLHLVFSVVTILGNVNVIYALWKASSIPSNLRKLFLSLAFSDLAVGLLGQLMFGVVILMTETTGNFDFLCPTILTVCHFFTFLLACASFLTVTAIAVDRLLAISLHLRYQELVTSKRVILVLISLWTTSVVAACVYISLPKHSGLVAVVLECVGLPSTALAYIRIYKVVRYHRNQIQSQVQVPNTQGTDLVREKKSALNAVYVYVVFLACYLPYLCSLIGVITNSSRMSFWLAEHSSQFLVLLNSSLNPLVYCWRYREIREIVKRAVKKTFRINDMH